MRCITDFGLLISLLCEKKVTDTITDKNVGLKLVHNNDLPVPKSHYKNEVDLANRALALALAMLNLLYNPKIWSTQFEWQSTWLVC